MESDTSSHKLARPAYLIPTIESLHHQPESEQTHPFQIELVAMKKEPMLIHFSRSLLV
jgi:hypothetical protein